jgi:hypothetical protein
MLFQLTVCGPAPVKAPPLQPLQFQLYVAPAAAVPPKVKVAVALVVEASVQIEETLEAKILVGVGLTVTKTVVIGEVQVTAPGFTTVRVRVFVPEVFQLTVWGPIVLLGAVMHASQSQVKEAEALLFTPV